MTFLTKMDTPIGKIIVASNGDSLTGLWFEGQKCECAFVERPVWEDELPLWEIVSSELHRYFKGEGSLSSRVPIAFVGGTPFQKAVWEVLMDIPYQNVWSYKEVGRRLEMKLGRRISSRSVGAAIGKNPISLFVPCHRVISVSVELTGYAGGLHRKKALLTLEGHFVIEDRLIPKP